jgi:hypothetical protein
MRYVIPSNEWSGTTTFQPGWGLMMATSFACLLACLLHHHRQILDLGVLSIAGCREAGTAYGGRRGRGREGERSRASDPVLEYETRKSTPSTNDILALLVTTAGCSRRSGGIAHVYYFAPTIRRSPISRYVVRSTSVSKRSARSIPTKQKLPPLLLLLQVPMPGNLSLPALTTSRDRPTAPLHTDTTKERKVQGVSKCLKR